MDSVLAKHIDVLIQDTYDDDDSLIVIFGDEGAGKSVLESQIQKRISKKTKIVFNIRKGVHFEGQKLINAALEGVPRQVNCLDESRRTLSKMRMATAAQENFMNFLSECRSLNQFNIIVLPAYSDLSEDVATRRCKLVIKVVKLRDPNTKRLKRGYFQMINTRNRKNLKKLYKSKAEEVPKQMVSHQGRFDKVMGWDEVEYKTFKEEEKRDNFLEKKTSEHTFTDKQILEMVHMAKMPNPHKKEENPARQQVYNRTQKTIKAKAIKIIERQQLLEKALEI